MIQMLNDICKDIYGNDSRKFPTLNVVVMARADAVQYAQQSLNRFIPIVNNFRGRYEFILDIRDHMTREELEALEELEGFSSLKNRSHLFFCYGVDTINESYTFFRSCAFQTIKDS